jgi:uncharacterized membrane protein YbaN (DUF454 family)
MVKVSTLNTQRDTISWTYKTLLIILGWVCVALGFMGAFLPVLPTTPFLLLAAYFFSKSSPRFHRWLIELPYFGEMIQDWNQNKVIRPKAKMMAISAIVIIFSATLYFTNIHLGLKFMLVIIALSCAAFILTRKSHP